MNFNFGNAQDSATNPLSYFSNVSQEYEQYRPSYPREAMIQMLWGLKPPSQLVAADIGAGTGIGSRLLAEQGLRVWAIEPNAQMRVSATAHPRVEFIAGTAENIPLETASVDLVVCFQAFHWFDFLKSLHEFHRILKPDGRLALIWNFWDHRDEISKRYTQILHAASNEQIGGASSQLSIHKLVKTLRYQLFWQGLWLPYFRNLQRYYFTYEQYHDLAGLLGLARSQGFVACSGAKLDNLTTELTVLRDRCSQDQGLVRIVYSTHLYLADLSRRSQK